MRKTRVGRALLGVDQRTVIEDIEFEESDDGGEIGAFHAMYLPQRLTALRARLDEFLRLGLTAGVLLEH